MPKFRLPAEWERQRGVQLTWPHPGTDWRDTLCCITDTYLQMAYEIARREPLLVVAQRALEARAAIEAAVPDRIAGNISYVCCDTDDTWARDHGFITLADGEGGYRLLDFRFNGWGAKFKADKDNAINRSLFPYLPSTLFDEGCRLEYADCLDFVLEGGSIESDGRGTVFTTSPCLLAPNRNQPMDKADIERRLKATLCAERIVWIDHGRLEGDDTDGHIDTLVRLAPGDTLLYIGAGDDPTDPQGEELRLMERQLQQLRTAEGKPYHLLKLPSPRPITSYTGERLPATYANFLILNDTVLLPTYGQPDRDAEAAEVVRSAFPGRKVVGIDCRPVIVQHGSLHCCTMQYPL